MDKDEGNFEYILGLQKIETDVEEHLIIAGIATSEMIDHDSEIVDMESVRSVWKDYLINPVIRYLHNKDPKHQGAIGKVIPEFVDKAGKTWKTEMTENGPFIVAKISNAPDTESIRKKISEGIYKGLSIGGSAKRVLEYSHELGKEINRVLTQRISEISVVDLPANKDSFFNVIKSSCIGDQCKINVEEMDGKESSKHEDTNTNDADMLKSVEEEIEKLEKENDDLRKEIELRSHTSPSESEVVMKNTDTTILGGKNMAEQEENIVRFEPKELKDFIKSTMNEHAEESAILEKAEDYDRLLAEMKDLRSKIEGLEAKVKSQASALKASPQTAMKSEETDESGDGDAEKSETPAEDVDKMEALSARLKAVEESPLYKATQDGEDMDEKDKKKTKKGHLANIVSESFRTGGK